MEAQVQTGLLPGARDAHDLHAGFWLRVVAYIIDILIVDAVFFVIMFAVYFIFFEAERGTPAEADFLGLSFWILGAVLFWLYFALFESSRLQATPGKLVLRLAVTDLYGQRIGFGRATGRFFGKYLSALILEIGFMMAGWTERKQGLHDLIAQTCVVRKAGLERLRTSGYSGTTAAAQTPGWVIALVGAGAALAGIAVIAILAAIAIPIYLNYTARAQVDDAVGFLARTTVTLTREYSRLGAWPLTIGAVDPADARVPVSRYIMALRLVDCRGQYCGVEALMRNGAGLNDRVVGRTIEIWTLDGGNSWACGPGSSRPIDPHFLPADCRSPGAP